MYDIRTKMYANTMHGYNCFVVLVLLLFIDLLAVLCHTYQYADLHWYNKVP